LAPDPPLRNTDAPGDPIGPGTSFEPLVFNRNHDGGRTRDNDDDTLLNQTDLAWKFGTGGVRPHLDHRYGAGARAARPL